MSKRTPNVRVGAFWKSSKGRYFLWWKDQRNPAKRRTRQTDITTRSKRSEHAAIVLAKNLEAELNQKSDQTSWDRFCDRYMADYLSDTSRANQDKWRAVRKIADAVMYRDFGRELRLDEITPLFVASVETEVRRRLAAGSVPSYMATFCGALSWASSMELMRPLPRRRNRGRQTIELPAMRLQPISEDGLRRMISAAKKVVGKDHYKSVGRYLTCLFLSGCRMTDPIWIHPFRLDCHHPLDIDGPHPMLCWTARQKNRKDQIRRITLEFAADLRRYRGRDAFPYRPRCETGEITTRTPLTKLVSEIGRVSGVIAEPPDKTVTAKHFRSSFVTRWSLRGMPLELIQSMCRHGSRSTTERYYLGDVNSQREFNELRVFGDRDGDQIGGTG